jgi:hypothetical protein
MVQVSRTLRRRREERVVIVDRHVVIILDLDELRRAAGIACAEETAPLRFPQELKLPPLDVRS